MRILLVSPFLPYPDVPHAGGKLVFFLLSSLAKKHSVFLVSRTFPGEERNLPLLREMLSGIATVPAEGPVREGDPRSLLKTVSSYVRLAGAASAVLGRETFDACQVEHSETGAFWKPPREIPAFLTCHDILAKPAFRRYAAARGPSKPLSWMMWKGKAALERRSVYRFRQVFALSDEDRAWAEKLYPGISVRVLRYPGGIGFTGLPRREASKRILFLGAMHRPPNIEGVRYFFERVWPAVKRQVSGAQFWVAGGGIPQQLREDLSRDPQVRVAGFVARPEGLYKSAAVFVAPVLAGGGVIVKILDALAAGVPVVTTSYGNEGILAKDGRDIFVADDPGAFASSVVRVLRDAALRRNVEESGRRFVEANFSAEALVESVEAAYREAVDAPFPA